jgi:hypothetical protein
MKVSIKKLTEQLLDKCQNFYGRPLAPDVRARLQAVLDNPTIETWEDAHGIILRTEPKSLTLWQAWIAIDPRALRHGRLTDLEGNVIEEWERIPDRFTLMRALKYATEQ